MRRFLRSFGVTEASCGSIDGRGGNGYEACAHGMMDGIPAGEAMLTRSMRLEPGRFFRVAAAVLGILGFATLAGVAIGCQKSDPGRDLKDRVAKYWQLKQSKGWEEIYDKFLDPSAKSQLTKEAFLRRRSLAFDILSFEVGEVQQTGDAASVEVANEVNFPLRTPKGEMQLIKKRITTKDPWAQHDGVWYVVLTE